MSKYCVCSGFNKNKKALHIGYVSSQMQLIYFTRVSKYIYYLKLTNQELTTIKKVVNRSDLQDTLHIFMQDANFRLSIGIDHKFC